MIMKAEPSNAKPTHGIIVTAKLTLRRYRFSIFAASLIRRIYRSSLLLKWYLSPRIN